MKLQTQSDVLQMLKLLANDYPNIRLGLAGSFSRNEQIEESDIDIVFYLYNESDNDDMSIFFGICDFLDEKYSENKFDVLCLNYLEQKDKEMDAFSISQGPGIVEESVYKNILRDMIWVN